MSETDSFNKRCVQVTKFQLFTCEINLLHFSEKIQEKKNPKREEAESSCFVANVRLESDEESNHISSQERIDREDKKGLTSQSRFVTLTIRYWDVKNSRLVSFINPSHLSSLHSLDTESFV